MTNVSKNPDTIAKPLGTRPLLTEEDWNFSVERVADEELVPCLLFEFLRESITARQLEQGLIAKLPSTTAADLAEAKRLLKRLHALRFNINHPLQIDQFINQTIAPSYCHTDLLKMPWQRLPAETKATLKYFCNDVDKPVSISTSEFETDELARKMQNDVRRDMEAFHKDNQSPSTTYARAPLDGLDGYAGSVIYGVVAHYQRYDDNAIRAGMAKLTEEIIAGRPKGIKPQMRKESGAGRTAEWQGILNSLGLARLSARCTALQLQTQMPKIYNQIAKSLTDKGTTAVQKKLDGARRRFIKRFHEILPFEKHPPLCLAKSKRAK